MIIAIDPGKNGAIAYQYPNKLKSPVGFNWNTTGVVSMPKTEQEIIDLFCHLCELKQDGEIVVYLEKVHAMPGQGVVSMFTFGHGYGFLRGVIQTLGLKLVDVTPQKWQGKLGLLKKSKDEIYQYAQQRNPNLEIHRYSADAVAMLEYALEIESERQRSK